MQTNFEDCTSMWFSNEVITRYMFMDMYKRNFSDPAIQDLLNWYAYSKTIMRNWELYWELKPYTKISDLVLTDSINLGKLFLNHQKKKKKKDRKKN